MFKSRAVMYYYRTIYKSNKSEKKKKKLAGDFLIAYFKR